MYVIAFNEYLKLSAEHRDTARIKKERKSDRFGYKVEEAILSLIQEGDCRIEPQSPSMDIEFGADAKFMFVENGVNRSVYCDITMNKNKQFVKYLTVRNEWVEDYNQALTYDAGSFTIRFGVKERHYNRFFYEKPVVVILVSMKGGSFEIDDAHKNNIVELLKLVSFLLEQQGFGKRASLKVRPNLRRFGKLDK